MDDVNAFNTGPKHHSVRGAMRNECIISQSDKAYTASQKYINQCKLFLTELAASIE